ncbi:MAG: dipeptide ABC transporter ATP-binding protein [Gammaproteobacteria bacterium]
MRGLTVRVGTAAVVDGLDFDIDRGETFVLVGESGCGKSMTALALMRLLPHAASVAAGTVRLGGEELLQLPERAMRDVRGRRVAMIFQEPQTSLNPVLSVQAQIAEVLARHLGLGARAARTRVVDLLAAVGIPDPQRRADEYPHQLSGGMKQRVMIAMALAGEPDLLIADEPTTALDVTIQAQVLDLLRGLQRRTGMAMLLITHDLGVVREMADRVGVMYAGQIVESAPAATFFADPLHPYSRKLFDSLPAGAKRDRPLAVIRGMVPPAGTPWRGCRFAARCDYAIALCEGEPPRPNEVHGHRLARCHMHDPAHAAVGFPEPAAPAHPARAAAARADTPLLEVEALQVHFPIHRGVFRRVAGHVYAVDGVSLAIPAGRTLALVGESGCGKTTAGKGILRLLPPTGGRVRFDGTDLASLDAARLRAHRRDMQFIFQDPYSSMNPRMMVCDIVTEGMVAQGIGADRDERYARARELLQQVGLSAEAMQRYPHEFSGGQRQRICIARALAVQPRLIVCDEPTSALDVSVQAQILNLLKDLQDRLGIAYLFITHNLAVVEYLAHRIAVMYLGRIVEEGDVGQVMRAPRHPYTRALLSAVPVVDATSEREIIRLPGDLPSPSAPPAGCHFHPRCPQAFAPCRQSYPAPAAFGHGHTAACHLYAQAPAGGAAQGA